MKIFPRVIIPHTVFALQASSFIFSLGPTLTSLQISPIRPRRFANPFGPFSGEWRVGAPWYYRDPLIFEAETYELNFVSLLSRISTQRRISNVVNISKILRSTASRQLPLKMIKMRLPRMRLCKFEKKSVKQPIIRC